MTRTRRQIAKHLATYTDAQLEALWVWCGEQRVKTGAKRGHVKIKAAKLGDLVLREQISRRPSREFY